MPSRRPQRRFPYLWTVWPAGVLDRQKHLATKALSDARKNQLADLTEAIRLAPNDFYTYFARAHVYEEEGNLDKAAADYTKVIQLGSLTKDTYLKTEAVLARASLHGKRGERDEAIADYSEVIQHRASAAIYCVRADLYEEKGDLDKAIADYNEAVQDRPG